MIKLDIDAHGLLNVYLQGLPMPPTINQSMAIVRGRLISTASKRLFFNEVNTYRIRNFKALQRAANSLQQLLATDPALCFRVDCYFALPHNKLFTKDGRVKIFDANNRLKSALDGLSELIQIDDKYFASGIAEKITTRSIKPSFTVHIKPQHIRSDDQINELLGL